MTRAQCLKRVLGTELTNCVHRGGAVWIVARTQEPYATLAHFEKLSALAQAHYQPAARTARGRRMTPRLARCTRQSR